jgi:hypothetical protein
MIEDEDWMPPDETLDDDDDEGVSSPEECE